MSTFLSMITLLRENYLSLVKKQPNHLAHSLFIHYISLDNEEVCCGVQPRAFMTRLHTRSIP